MAQLTPSLFLRLVSQFSSNLAQKKHYIEISVLLNQFSSKCVSPLKFDEYFSSGTSVFHNSDFL